MTRNPSSMAFLAVGGTKTDADLFFWRTPTQWVEFNANCARNSGVLQKKKKDVETSFGTAMCAPRTLPRHPY